jgi:hypothetical protein
VLVPDPRNSRILDCTESDKPIRQPSKSRHPCPSDANAGQRVVKPVEWLFID